MCKCFQFLPQNICHSISITFDLNLFHFDSVIPKNALKLSIDASAADDVVSVSSHASKTTQNGLKDTLALTDDFVFVTPKGIISRMTSDDIGGTASGESFISCDDASVSTMDGITIKNKRKRVRKRKKKNSIGENGETMEVIAEPAIAKVLPNPIIKQSINSKSNTHVRYVANVQFIFILKCM